MTISKNLREVVLDTETTGLNHAKGDRIVDIACVELINHIPTGNTYQVYINPEREMQRDATAISGITDEFLADKPLFHEIVDDFLNFVQDSILIIHNAKFDIGFLNSELSRLDKPLFHMKNTIDTLEIARKKFPGSPASLDALCKRFEIDTSGRTKHGALIDCFLLSEVYINLLGGRQSDLSFHNDNLKIETVSAIKNTQAKRAKRNFAVSTDEKTSHEEFLKVINNPFWKR
ncbi:MAG: DNA polymerase III subunit epsilon [Holosporaceae bacterium]|jgi:DNA polymerase-3 subunit epsilon|nr:DNA polymerase III subunit epsilon [Holosporaceae bacterium]